MLTPYLFILNIDNIKIQINKIKLQNIKLIKIYIRYNIIKLEYDILKLYNMWDQYIYDDIWYRLIIYIYIFFRPLRGKDSKSVD